MGRDRVIGPLLTCNQTNADIADIASFKSAKHFHTNIDVHYIMIQFKVSRSCEQICPMTGLIQNTQAWE